MRLPALTLLAAALAGHANGDEIPPGYKTVSHGIYVEGLERFPGYDFYIFPTRVMDGADRVVSGRPLSFYKLSGPRLYALRRPAPQKPDKAVFSRPEVPRSEEPFRMISTVPQADSTRAIKTIFKVNAIEGAVIKLERVKEERISGSEAPRDSVLVALSACGILALALAGLRRR
jgi:hypothetical protein